MVVLKQFPYFIEKAEKILPFWEGLNEGKFKTTKCQNPNCGAIHFPPRILCPECYSTQIEWVNLPTTGTVETFTHVEIPPEGFAEPYYLAMVQMDQLEKPILARYAGEEAPEIGQKVKMAFEEVGEQKLPVFVPA